MTLAGTLAWLTGIDMWNSRNKSSLVLQISIAALATLFSVPASAQSLTPQQDQPAQNEGSDLINPDRPGIADGSTVIGAKRFQIESGIQEEFRRSGDGREHAFFVPTLLRFGIDSHWEARIEGNTLTRVTSFDSADMPNDTSGFAPISMGLKYHIYDSNGDHQISLGIIGRVFPAWGSKEFHPQHATGDIRLAVDWNLAPGLKLSVNPNIGVGRYEDDKGSLFTSGLFAITLNYLPNKKLNPFIDLGLQSPEAKDSKAGVILDSGLAYIIGRNLQIDASIGTGIHGDTAPKPFLGIGISWRSKSFHSERRHGP